MPGGIFGFTRDRRESPATSEAWIEMSRSMSRGVMEVPAILRFRGKILCRVGPEGTSGQNGLRRPGQFSFQRKAFRRNQCRGDGGDSDPQWIEHLVAESRVPSYTRFRQGTFEEKKTACDRTTGSLVSPKHAALIRGLQPPSLSRGRDSRRPSLGSRIYLQRMGDARIRRPHRSIPRFRAVTRPQETVAKLYGF